MWRWPLFGHGKIRVLKQDGSIEEMISFGDPKTTELRELQEEARFPIS